MPKNEIQTTPSEESLQALRSMFPKEPGFERRLLSRLSLTSQDKTEGKGKNMKVIKEAGTFYIERQSDTINETTGKKDWIEEEVGTEIEATIIFNRKQLSYYDSAEESYASTPIYDNDDEVIPLFKNGAEIARGTAKDLQALYPAKTRTGKPTSALKDNVILYVLYNDELFQMSLHGTSMYAYKTYKRSTRPGVNEYITRFSSEAKEMGSTEWNQMTFLPLRPLTAEEVNISLAHALEMTNAIKDEKEFFASLNKDEKKDDWAADFEDNDLPQLTN